MMMKLPLLVCVGSILSGCLLLSAGAASDKACRLQDNHLWVPIPLVSGSPFAHINMDRGGVQAFQLPYSVPQYNVTEVLLYIKLFTNGVPENVDDIRIFTQIKGVEYSKYLYLYLSSLNSDNIWLPLGEDRSVYVELEAYHTESDAMYMYAIGYR